MTCRFEALAEHKANECPLCNPYDWMLRDDAEISLTDLAATTRPGDVRGTDHTKETGDE